MLGRQTTDIETERQRIRIRSALRDRPKLCRFQLERNKYHKDNTVDNHGHSKEPILKDVEGTDTETVVRAKTVAPKVLPTIKSQVKLYFVTQFLSNTRKSVERRRRLDCPWMRGNEMQHFYSVWQQPLTTPKQRMKKPLRRVQSMLKDFRYPDEKNKSTKQADFGIVRHCCTKIRSRIRMPGDPP